MEHALLLANIFAKQWQGLILFVAVAAMIIFVLRYRRTPQNQDSHREHEDEYRNIETHPAVAHTIDDLLHRLHRMDADTNARIDTRLRALQQLLREADLKIEELRRLQYLAQTVPPQPPDETTADPTPPAPEAPEITPTTSSSPDQPIEQESQESINEHYAETYKLQDAGLSEYEIARKSNLTISEIRFILSLRKYDQQ